MCDSDGFVHPSVNRMQTAVVRPACRRRNRFELEASVGCSTEDGHVSDSVIGHVLLEKRRQRQQPCLAAIADENVLFAGQTTAAPAEPTPKKSLADPVVEADGISDPVVIVPVGIYWSGVRDRVPFRRLFRAASGALKLLLI